MGRNALAAGTMRHIIKRAIQNRSHSGAPIASANIAIPNRTIKTEKIGRHTASMFRQNQPFLDPRRN